MTQHLDRCEQCEGGRFRRYCTRTFGNNRTRYLKCDKCGETDQEVFKVDHFGRVVIYPFGSTPPGTELSRHPLEQR